MSRNTNPNKPESYKKIKEVFTEMSDACGQLAERIDKQKNRMTGERGKLLLQWWHERVLALQDSLQQYLDDAGSKAVLDTWIQYVPKIQMVDSFEEQINQDDPDPNTVVDACKSAYNMLISFLNSIGDQTTGSVHKHLTSYITFLEDEKKKLVLSKENLNRM